MDKALNLSKVLIEHEKWLNGESGGKQANFTSQDLSGADLRGMNLEGAIFNGANLTGALLDGACFDNAQFKQANLRGASAKGANFYDADLSNAMLSAADLTHAGMQYVDLSGANLTYADLRSASLTAARLTEAIAYQASFENALLNSACLANANLEGANLTGASCRSADFINTDLRDALLLDANFEYANLHHPNLQGANLEGAELKNATLRGVDDALANQISFKVGAKANAQITPKGHIVLVQFENDALLYLGKRSPRPYVVAHGFDASTGEWAGNGTYYADPMYAWADINPEIYTQSLVVWQREDVIYALRENGIEHPADELIKDIVSRMHNFERSRESNIEATHAMLDDVTKDAICDAETTHRDNMPSEKAKEASWKGVSLQDQVLLAESAKHSPQGRIVPAGNRGHACQEGC